MKNCNHTADCHSKNFIANAAVIEIVLDELAQI